MKHQKLSYPGVAVLLVLATLAMPIGRPTASAQDDFGVGSDVFPNFTLGEFGDDQQVTDPVTLRTEYRIDANGVGVVTVTAEIAKRWHLYSVSQKPGGPLPTKITVTGPADVKVTGSFQPDQQPSKSVSSVYGGLTIEEHDGSVTWSAPIAAPVGFDDSITVVVNGQVCDSIKGACLPVRETLTAQYVAAAVLNAGGSNSAVAMDQAIAIGTGATSPKSTSASKPFRDRDYVVQWTASVRPETVAPGGIATLTFTATPDATFHVYRSATDDADSSTNFVVTQKSGLLVGKPSTEQDVISKSIVPSLPPVHYYNGNVTWTLPIKVPQDVTAGQKTIEGMIAYQACTENSCHRPVALSFKTTVTVAEANGTDGGEVVFASAKSATALDAAAETDWVDQVPLPTVAPETGGMQPGGRSKSNDDSSTEVVVSDSAGDSSDDSNGDDESALAGGPDAVAASGDDDSANADQAATAFPIILLFSFIGGVILNLMPCVLPVVGLKIMGFVSQAGEDRRRVLMLNLVYSAGILVVFAMLAILATVFKFGWGQQFTYFPVKLGLTLGLFALALSYLGVWEIPAPGMASSKASQSLQSREGLTGAFSKGVFATVLATPCSGPFLGYILGLTLGLSSWQTVMIFMTVGLGMSLPYLAIGFEPKLIAWLPKPGNWMETFKQLMAFLFLGTVAFFFAQFKDDQKLPVFVSLIGVWFGCWVVGQVPGWADLQKRLVAWSSGIIAAAIISVSAFTYLVPGPKVLAWEDYSEARLQQLQSEGKTVLLDFSAKWCVNCIYNYEVAINTERTRKLVDELDAVAMYADYTDFDPAIQQKLEQLQSRSIPLLVIYPGRAPDQPILLRDLVTQQNVLDALQQAGESVGPRIAGRSASVATGIPATADR